GCRAREEQRPIRLGREVIDGPVSGGRIRVGSGWVRGPGFSSGVCRNGMGPAYVDTRPPGGGWVSESLWLELGFGSDDGRRDDIRLALGGRPICECEAVTKGTWW
ncbi:UDP-glycosyltransferase 89a2, partial [Phtheirospermum japonicum]